MMIYCVLSIWLKSIVCAEILSLLVVIICWYKCRIANRFDWFEIHDQNWCPTIFKIFLRRFLWEVVWNDGLRAAKPVSETISKIILENKISFILDLCSGSCGPSKLINENINKNINNKNKIITILTDLYPQVDSWKAICQENENLLYSSQPINATNINVQSINKLIKNKGINIKPTVTILRSIFLAFHHFTPPLCMKIFQDTFKNKDAIIITDFIADKSLFGFLFAFFSFSILGIIGTIKIIQFWLFTCTTIKNVFYALITIILFPIFQFAQIHDALISNARMYGDKYLKEMSQNCLDHLNGNQIKNNKKMQYEFKFLKVDINANTFGIPIPSELQKSVIYVFACIPKA